MANIRFSIFRLFIMKKTTSTITRNHNLFICKKVTNISLKKTVSTVKIMPLKIDDGFLMHPLQLKNAVAKVSLRESDYSKISI